MLRNKNLIWDSLEKNQGFSGNMELKEFAMSITGMLIFDVKPTWLEPQTTRRDIIHALLNGGTAQIYTCNDSECLKTAVGKVTIGANCSLSGQVNKML